MRSHLPLFSRSSLPIALARRLTLVLALVLTLSLAPSLTPGLTLGLTPRLTLGLLGAAPASAATSSTPWPGHPGRHLVVHIVRSGDTATGLAVRYHAWTAELLALNHLKRSSTLRIGQRLRIPVVDAAVPKKHRHSHQAAPHRTHDQVMRDRGWRHYKLSRAEVRHVVTTSARRHHVPVSLALAIAWQESGWHQPLVSRAGAVGVMQLLPGTGRWMSLYADRALNIRDTHDNVLGGVLLIRVLRDSTRYNRNAIAAYYQGLGGIRVHGWYPSTKKYVKSVLAIKRRIERTGSPTG